jgi:hypothetical protein
MFSRRDLLTGAVALGAGVVGATAALEWHEMRLQHSPWGYRSNLNRKRYLNEDGSVDFLRFGITDREAVNDCRAAFIGALSAAKDERRRLKLPGGRFLISGTVSPTSYAAGDMIDVEGSAGTVLVGAPGWATTDGAYLLYLLNQSVYDPEDRIQVRLANLAFDATLIPAGQGTDGGGVDFGLSVNGKGFRGVELENLYFNCGESNLPTPIVDQCCFIAGVDHLTIRGIEGRGTRDALLYLSGSGSDDGEVMDVSGVRAFHCGGAVIVKRRFRHAYLHDSLAVECGLGFGTGKVGSGGSTQYGGYPIHLSNLNTWRCDKGFQLEVADGSKAEGCVSWEVGRTASTSPLVYGFVIEGSSDCDIDGFKAYGLNPDAGRQATITDSWGVIIGGSEADAARNKIRGASIRGLETAFASSDADGANQWDGCDPGDCTTKFSVGAADQISSIPYGFSAHRNGTVLAAPQSANTDIVFTTFEKDLSGGTFNLATGEFTPKHGWFNFMLAVTFNPVGLVAGQTIDLYCFKNGSSTGGRRRLIEWDSTGLRSEPEFGIVRGYSANGTDKYKFVAAVGATGAKEINGDMIRTRVWGGSI